MTTSGSRYPLESVVGGVAHILAHGDSVPQGQTPNRSGVRATSARRLGGKGPPSSRRARPPWPSGCFTSARAHLFAGADGRYAFWGL